MHENVSVPNVDNLGSFIFLLFDPVHIFKNLYNNWMAKEIFESPHVDSRGNKTYLPQFLPFEGTLCSRTRKITNIN